MSEKHTLEVDCLGLLPFELPMLQRIAYRLRQRRWQKAVRAVQRRLEPGCRVSYIEPDGIPRTGMILNVRQYADGGVEGFFLADDRSTMCWKPATQFFPEYTNAKA